MTKSVGLKDLEKQAELVEEIVEKLDSTFTNTQKAYLWSFVAFLNDTVEELGKYGNVTLVGNKND